MVKRKRKSTRVKAVPAVQVDVPRKTTILAAAGTGRRFGGFLIDYLLLTTPNAIILWYLKDNGLYSPIATIYNTFFAIIVLLYFIMLTWKNNGQTVGKQIVGTRVAPWKGKVMSGPMIFVRYTTLFVLVQFPQIFSLLAGGKELGIGWLLLNVLAVLLVLVLLIIDDEHRGLHDLIAGTWVVRSKNTP